MTENPRTSEAPPATRPNDGASSSPAAALPTLREKLEAQPFGVSAAGDPPSVGGYTDIVGVWDVSAVGLIRYLKMLNDGVDFTGKSVGRQASFLIGGSANLNADPLEPELRLMRRKVEAGAHVFVTQNIFEEKKLEAFLDGAAKFKRPIIVGVLPLADSPP